MIGGKDDAKCADRMNYAVASGTTILRQARLVLDAEMFFAQGYPMSDAFTIKTEVERRLIVVQPIGHWTPEMVSPFEKALHEAIDSLADGSEGIAVRPNVLIDARIHGIQSQEIVAAFQELAVRMNVRVNRIAVVTEGVLHRIQARRLNTAAHRRMFASLETAREWLTSSAVDESSTPT